MTACSIRRLGWAWRDYLPTLLTIFTHWVAFALAASGDVHALGLENRFRLQVHLGAATGGEATYTHDCYAPLNSTACSGSSFSYDTSPLSLGIAGQIDAALLMRTWSTGWLGLGAALSGGPTAVSQMSGKALDLGGDFAAWAILEWVPEVSESFGLIGQVRVGVAKLVMGTDTRRHFDDAWQACFDVRDLGESCTVSDPVWSPAATLAVGPRWQVGNLGIRATLALQWLAGGSMTAFIAGTGSEKFAVNDRLSDTTRLAVFVGVDR